MTDTRREIQKVLSYLIFCFAAALAGFRPPAHAELIRGEIIEVNEIDGTGTMKFQSSSAGPL